MKQAETLLLEVKVLDDGAVIARRKDRRRLTAKDREDARKVADELPGVTAADVLRVFGGGAIREKR
jgi:hypothetical protein